MKKIKYKVKFRSVFISLLLIFLVIFIISFFYNKKIYMIDLVNMDINTAKEKLNEYKMKYDIIYEYNEIILEDRVISQSILADTLISVGDEIIINVSKGKIPIDKYKSDGINELGRVPIMMYHGIKNMKNEDTEYTNGNVDKDGYTRTSEAFRNDLEFYYEKGYRMIKLSDYVNGKIDVLYGYSPIILTFDDGNANNIKVKGIDSNGNIVIDENSAVGILEDFKRKHPDVNVTAIFFITNNLFNQKEYDEKIINWLVDNGYEVGNHTRGHDNFSNISVSKTEEVVGYMYNKLNSIIPNRYSKIVALPYGSPYDKNHENYSHIISGSYDGHEYNTMAALRVGWEPEVSPFDKKFDPTFLKRCRAYDNNGHEFDIEMVFKNLEKSRYISDGDVNTIVASSSNSKNINNINNINKKVILY